MDNHLNVVEDGGGDNSFYLDQRTISLAPYRIFESKSMYFFKHATQMKVTNVPPTSIQKKKLACAEQVNLEVGLDSEMILFVFSP